MVKINTIPIEQLGECKVDSPFIEDKKEAFVEKEDSVVVSIHKNEILECLDKKEFSFFELAGPRKQVYFDNNITCAVVTCGGLCPGINDVIRGIVVELSERYGVKKVLGFRYGYRGLSSKSEFSPVELNSDNVDDIHTRGGTILSSSRGPQDLEDMVNTLLKYNIKILFTIGGDGTITGASKLAAYIKQKKLGISIIAIPKTIDNDIQCVDKSFGFETAVQETHRIIESAHQEAKGALNGIGLVKLMGRESGFITAYSTLANINVNYCLIPEKPFRLKGTGGFLEVLKNRIQEKHHAVIVVAEGAGQDLLNGENSELTKDASGNLRLKDVGIYLKSEIKGYFNSNNMEVNIKYFDPSYSIRSVPANAMDSAYCLILAQSAVHAGMAGKTNMLISYVNNHYVHIPIEMAIQKRRQIDPDGRLWHTVMDSTLQPWSVFENF
ncbi:ATP-dependent 6-phosphofructokinase [bacterium]